MKSCISDQLNHSTNSVYTFQEILVNHLKEKLSFAVKKIIYFSDGCAEQYKNRQNFINFTPLDFDNPAEWHFFATSYRIGPYDGIGVQSKEKPLTTA